MKNVGGGCGEGAKIFLVWFLGFPDSQVQILRDRGILAQPSGTWTAPFYTYYGYFTGINAGGTNPADVGIDWVIVRKYVSTIHTSTFEIENSVSDYQPP